MPAPALLARWALPATIVTYIVGLVGLLYPATRTFFITLTPIHLLYVIGLLLAMHGPTTPRTWATWLGIGLAGYGIEWLGVHTGLIFGQYYYGQGLGWQLSQVPLLIAGNWLLMCYTSTALAQRYLQHPLPVAATAASLMVITDLLLEPLAPSLDYWHWPAGSAPLQNYIAWWLYGAALCYALHRNLGRLHNAIAIPIYILQAAFFIVLLLWR